MNYSQLKGRVEAFLNKPRDGSVQSLMEAHALVSDLWRAVSRLRQDAPLLGSANQDVVCSICGVELPNARQRNNAQPVNNGSCCSECNITVVVPMRIRRYGQYSAQPTQSQASDR
jgi:hypothetical protein